MGEYFLKNTWLIWAVMALCLIVLLCGVASADNICPERLADAIFRAENSKSHPYGILTHYKHTTPRQACINTINHALRDWNGKGDFIAFLGSRYAPIGAKNDPKGLNKNWVRLVRYFYEKSSI
jgi:NRPS condensation-like uncharacterized protein